MGYILKDCTGWDLQNVAVGRINEVAALTRFSYEKCMVVLPEKILAVTTRWP